MKENLTLTVLTIIYGAVSIVAFLAVAYWIYADLAYWFA